MRDVYYQSAGNPLQADRLPTSRPEIELLALPGGADVLVRPALTTLEEQTEP